MIEKVIVELSEELCQCEYNYQLEVIAHSKNKILLSIVCNVCKARTSSRIGLLPRVQVEIKSRKNQIKTNSKPNKFVPRLIRGGLSKKEKEDKA